MRNFLPEQTIVGAMLVSQYADILDITIPSLMNQCDWALVVMDNESKEVEEKMYEFQKKYGNIILRRSSLPHRIVTRNKNELTYRKRNRRVKGIFREDVFINLRRILDLNKKNRNRIDILLWPDSDEIFTDSLPELLERFWESGRKAIMTKPVDVVHDMQTIKGDSMCGHVRILRYSREFSAFPYNFFAMYYPIKGRKDVLKEQYYSVHLAYLNEDIRGWRRDNWKTDKSTECDLWKLEKSVEKMTPKEIHDTLKRSPDIKFNK